jgi:hypothetical protein
VLDIETVGKGLTTIVIVRVEEQAPIAPVTVKVVVTVGDTTAVAVSIFPGFQVKDAAPEALNVVLLPIHILVDVAEALTVGVGVTNKLCVVELIQPKALVPVTVNTVEVAGLTVTVAPLKLPGFQVKDVAPEAVNVAVFPLQIVVGEAEAIIVGVGLTVIAIVRVDEHIPLAPVNVNTVEVVGDTTATVVVIFPGFQV